MSNITIDELPLNEYIKRQREQGEVIEQMTGETTITNYNGNIRTTQIRNGSCVITRKGRTYTLQGNLIEHKDGEWYVDGKCFDFNGKGVDLEKDIVNIEIHGDVQTLDAHAATVTVHGNANVIKTSSGDVYCQEAVTINTMSGDVNCKGRPNVVDTMSGDINCS